MTQDPYALCPCGTGTKSKWCTAKAGMQQLERAIGMIRNNQQEASLALLDKLIAETSESECFRAYATTVKAQALDAFGRPEEGVQIAEEATQTFPNSGIVHETLGDFFFADHGYAEALDIYSVALPLFPPAATGPICRTLLKVGTCHNFQGRPLAAWAAWKQALRIDPEFKPAQESIEEFIHSNRLLPNPARHGLQLRTADEFAQFHEEIGDKWEQALAEGAQFHLDDLAMAFEAVTSKEPANAAAWYNLGLAYSWMGQNVKAIEALSKYVELEPDASLAADAWDLSEVLRMGAGAEDLSDNLLHIALYAVIEPQQFVERLQASKHIVVVATPDGHRTLHWMNKEAVPTEGGVTILGGPPRQLAQFNMYGAVLEIVATSEESLREVQAKFEPVVGPTARFESTMIRAGNPSTLDAEPFLIFDDQKGSPEERQAKTLDAVRSYFEETWLSRPLRTLGGVPPIDAGHSPQLRKKLEGAIRFRERNFARHEVAYNFDRLRNKLGLPISGTGLADEKDSSKPSADVDLSAYSAAQLASLDPAKLSDDELLRAYRSALSVDAGRTANQFAEQLIHRDDLADKVDMNSVFRRLILDKLSAKKATHLVDLIGKARAFDERHYNRREAAQFDFLSARASLLEGRKEEALKTMSAIPDHHPERLDVAASAVESLLSLGEYATAKSLAEKGLQRAEQNRDGDLQNRFREYLREAAARA